MPVRARIALFFALIFALVLSGAGLLLVTRLRSEVRATVDAGLRSRTEILLTDVNNEFGDVGKHEGVIDEAEPMAQIFDERGRLLEGSKSLGDEPLLSRSEVSSVLRIASFEKTADLDAETEDVRLLATRARVGAVVVVGASVEDAKEAVAALARSLVVGGPIVLVLAAFAVWLLTGVALRPVERMRSEAEALSFGSERRRLPVPNTGDELARLAETLNTMLARLEDAIERERRFVDDASHELRSPLAVLKAELELALRRSRSRDELEAAIRSAGEEVDDLAALTEHLLLLARADRGLLATRRQRTDLSALVEQVCAGFEPRAREVDLELKADGNGHVWAEADPLLVRQAIANLVDNALGHTPVGGRIVVEVSSNGDGTSVSVSDSGPGFDTEVLPHAFEPFVQADGARTRGTGTGLGLAIVHAIAQAHGGSADVQNRPSGGAVVTLRLPA